MSFCHRGGLGELGDVEVGDPGRVFLRVTVAVVVSLIVAVSSLYAQGVVCVCVLFTRSSSSPLVRSLREGKRDGLTAVGTWTRT